MVRSYLKSLCHGQDSSASNSKMNKKERKTEKEMGNNVNDWTGLEFGESVRAVENMSSVLPQRPSMLRD